MFVGHVSFSKHTRAFLSRIKYAPFRHSTHIDIGIDIDIDIEIDIDIWRSTQHCSEVLPFKVMPTTLVCLL